MDDPFVKPGSRTRQSEDSEQDAYLPATAFEGYGLTRAKKLRSPVRSNESSSSMRTPIPALVVDLERTGISGEESNDADGEEEEEDVSSSGSSTPRASRQSSASYARPFSLPSYAGWDVERSPTPPEDEDGDEPHVEEVEYVSSLLSPARADFQDSEEEEDESPPRPDKGKGRLRKNAFSVSTTGTNRPPRQLGQSIQSSQEVLDAIIDDFPRIQRGNSADQEEEEVAVFERSAALKPARNLRQRRS